MRFKPCCSGIASFHLCSRWLCAALPGLVLMVMAGCGPDAEVGREGSDALVGAGGGPAAGEGRDAVEIVLTGSERRWTARYPGGDGEWETADDVVTPGVVTVPAGRAVRLHLRSEDLLYLFALPHEGLREIAVPGLSFHLDWVPTQVGEFPLLGGEMCGRPGTLHGTLRVVTSEEFSW